MSLLAAVCLGLILIISSHVIQSQAFNILSLTVRGNIPKISSADGKLSLDSDFSFYSNDVYMLIYSKDKALLSGQAPPSFPVSTELENGVSPETMGDFTFWTSGFPPAGTAVIGSAASCAARTEARPLIRYSLSSP